MTKVEAFNINILGGEVQELALSSGHTCYKVALQEHMASTRMMLPGDDDGEKVRRFVPMVNAPVYKYNSKYPVVAYIPENAELRYSVWTGSEMITAAQE
ncbi:ecotin [Angomonas deanei]|nr:ecotin [Angomonas deanei]|eukprot:EPY41132.1 ecotin [Angomonas deanei]